MGIEAWRSWLVLQLTHRIDGPGRHGAHVVVLDGGAFIRAWMQPGGESLPVQAFDLGPVRWWLRLDVDTVEYLLPRLMEAWRVEVPSCVPLAQQLRAWERLVDERVKLNPRAPWPELLLSTDGA